MNKTVSLQLVVYSLLLAGLSYLAHFLGRGTLQLTLITGLVGGGFCMVWGIWALVGSRGKALPLLTLIPVSYILLTQTFESWSRGGAAATATIAVLVTLSVGMLLRIAWSGVVFDVQPGTPPKEGADQRPISGKGTTAKP
jgi:hypothetical protein